MGAKDRECVNSDDKAAILQFAVHESVRKLEAAYTRLDSIRLRAGTTVTMSTAIGGFIGALALQERPEGYQWLVAIGSLIAYILSVIISLTVFRPTPGWGEGLDTRRLVDAADGLTVATMHKAVVDQYQETFTSTSQQIDRLVRRLTCAIWFMVVELVLLVCLMGITTTNEAQTPIAGTRTTTMTPPAPPTTV